MYKYSMWIDFTTLKVTEVADSVEEYLWGERVCVCLCEWLGLRYPTANTQLLPGCLGRQWARLLTGQCVTLSKCLLTFGTGSSPCGGRPLHSAAWAWAGLAGVTRSCCTRPRQNHTNLGSQWFSIQIKTGWCTLFIPSWKTTHWQKKIR